MPRNLLFGIYTSILFYTLYGSGAVHASVKPCEHLFESDCVEGVEAAPRVYASGLFFKPGGQHGVYTCADAAEESLSWHLYPDEFDVEVAPALPACAQRRECGPAGAYYLECMHLSLIHI